MGTRKSAVLILTLSVVVAWSRPVAAYECNCPADLDSCGNVGINDVLILLEAWGPNPGHIADINEDGVVDGHDLGYLLGNFGACLEPLDFPQPGTLEIVVIDVTDATSLGEGLREYQMYLQFDHPEDVLLNVLDANISCESSPCFVNPEFDDSAVPLLELLWDALGMTYDSYVTVGLEYGDNNDVSLDPNFSQAEFDNGMSMGADAGWFVIPIGTQGQAGSYADNQVLIANLTTPEYQSIDGAFSVIYKEAEGDLRIATVTVGIGPCVADINEDSLVGVEDLLTLLAAWGPNPGHPADLDQDGTIGVTDLLILLGAWGPC